MGVVVAAIAGGCLMAAGGVSGGLRIALLLGAAVAIPVRLAANLFDGMLAVEGGLKTARGELYNELPDRLSDLLTLVGAGYAVRDPAWGRELGWAAAAAALLAAYVRTLGAAVGAGHHFDGPMAKPRRMHVMSVGCVIAALATAVGRASDWPLAVALVVVVVGGVMTIGRRLARIVAHLEGV